MGGVTRHLLKEEPVSRVLPFDIDRTHEAKRVDDVDRTVAEDLICDALVAKLRIACSGLHDPDSIRGPSSETVRHRE